MEASRRYLEHLRRAWDAKMPEAPFTSQQVLVTVPASFDAVARELTLEAAKQAGYENITILDDENQSTENLGIVAFEGFHLFNRGGASRTLRAMLE